jgi:RHS repeat-associated protein
MPDATTFATYDYGPFGELIRATGPYAAANSYRFSTKPQDVDTGHLYYNYRPYSTKIGRWLTRDPIGEKGGVNLYGFLGNNGVTRYDVLGLAINTRAEAVDYYRSNSGGTVDAGSILMKQIKESTGFRDSKNETINSIKKQIRNIPDICKNCSGKIVRLGKPIGFDAGNDVVGNISVDVESYVITWYQNSEVPAGFLGLGNKVKFYGTRKLSFKDNYTFNGTWRPKSWFTDHIPSMYAGSGTSYTIQGSWEDNISEEMVVYCGL